MGIYSSGKIFGIRIYNFNSNDFGNTLFEKKYDEIMNHQQMSEAYLFYNELNDKNDICFKIFTECYSTSTVIIEKVIFMDWYPIPLSMFLEKFKE